MRPFRILCGCYCARCGRAVILEGLEDADGNHYCRHCDDYVPTATQRCAEHTPDKIKAREMRQEGPHANSQ